jgi:hypothetical protein
MDEHRFDSLARLLSASGSRRGILAALVGAALPGPAIEIAAKGKTGRRRRRGKDETRTGGKGRGRDTARGKGSNRHRASRAKA